MSLAINIDVARKVLSTIDAGLVRGVGKPNPGEMCVEAAVCYALGLPRQLRGSGGADSDRHESAGLRVARAHRGRMNHYTNGSTTPEWLLMSASLRRDDGHSIEFRNGRVIVDGMASVDSYRSARELMIDPDPFRGVDGEVDAYLA